MAGLTKGLVQVYTGPGKGKTTAAVGLAVRAAGHGLRTCLIQFLKRGWESGEWAALAKLAPEIDMHVFGAAQWGDHTAASPDTPWWALPPSDEDRQQAQQAFDLARRMVASGEWDLVVLDEVFAAVRHGLVSAQDVVNLIAEKPAQVELVLTGRDAPPEVLAAADLVTEMKAVKHPFEQGVQARRGIEY
jgi:cob(I)alamin adenosyltransferase